MNTDQPVFPAPEPPTSGGLGFAQQLPAKVDAAEPSPFQTAFYNRGGDRIDLAAGGPFAEVLKALSKDIAPVALDAAEGAVQKQAEILGRVGHAGELPKHAININLDRIDDPREINTMIDAVASELAATVDEARRGTRSNAETLAAAHELFRKDEGFMLPRQVGQAFNAEQVTATRFVLASERQKADDFAQRILGGDQSPATLIGFKRQLSVMAAVQLQLHGMAAEAGRALQAFKIQAAPGLMSFSGKAAGATGDVPVQSTLPSTMGPAATPSPAAAPASPPSPVTSPVGAASPSAGAAAPGVEAGAAAAPAPAGSANGGQGATTVAGAPANAQPGQAGAAPGTPQAATTAAATQYAHDIQEFLDANGGIDSVVELARRWLDSTPPEKNAVARGSVDKGAADMLSEVWYNFVLSGPATHFVNMTGNAITLGTETAERAMAAKWGKLFGFLGLREGIAEGEAAAMTQTYWNAIGEAWKLANYAFRHGKSAGRATGYRMPMSTLDVWRMSQPQAAQLAQGAGAAPAAKVDAPREPAITGKNVLNAIPNAVNRASQHVLNRSVMNPVALGQRGMLGRFTDFLSTTIDLAGAGLRLPTRMLGAEDQFWKTLAYRGEASARAWREGTNAGLTGQQLRDYVDQVVNFGGMTPGDDAAAEAFARKVTMSESLQNGFAQGLQKAGSSKLGFLFAPFVKVTTNILDYSTARMAFPARPSWWADLFGRDPAKRDLAMARASTGAVMWMTAYAAASTGLDADDDAPIIVTGAAPRDEDLQMKAMWLRRGYKEYSVRLGGKKGLWVSYSRMDPAGQMLGIAADTVNIMHLADEVTKEEFAASIVAAIGNNVVNKNFMQTIADGMETFTSYDPEQWHKWLQKQAAGLAVPNVVTQYVAAQDPYLRKAVTIAEELTKRSSVEGRRALPLTRDIAGYPIEQRWLFGTRFSGISIDWGKEDPVADEILRLQMAFHKPTKSIHGIELNEQEYSRYQMLVGHGLKMPQGQQWFGPAVGKDYEVIQLDLSGKGLWEALGALIRHPVYKKATDGAEPPGQKVQMIERLKTLYTERAQARMIADVPSLLDRIVEANSAANNAKGASPDITQAKEFADRTALELRANQAKDYEVAE